MAKRRKGRPINGIFLLDKPLGDSSNRVLQWVRAIYQAQKAGHTGALDPAASGMLPICLGEATKFSQYLLDADKTYTVEAKLGERTTTSDAEGDLVTTLPVTSTESEVYNACVGFIGQSAQIPSMFSALKHEGKPLYWYARQGIEIARDARPIEIYSLTVDRIDLPYVTMTVHCSKGTYIRSLVDDIGQQLGCGAHVTKLHRSAVANYPADKMMSFNDLQALVDTYGEQRFTHIDSLLLPMDTALQGFAQICLNETQCLRFQHGNHIPREQLMELTAVDEQVRVYDQQHRFLGMATVTATDIQPKRVVVYE